MKRIIIACSVFLCLQTQAAEPDLKSKIRLTSLWLEETRQFYQIPGLAVAVAENDKIVWSAGFGVKSLETNEKMTAGTLFRIASISKLFTSVGIMQLRDAGMLHLDDPVRKYLPWFKLKNPYEDAPEVTIRHLLTHTSGLPRESDYPYWTGHKFPTRKQLIDMLPNQTMVYAPETEYKYSNLGMALLGEVIAAVSSMSYSAYIDTHILHPLGLGNTKVSLSENDRELLAVGYLRYRHGHPRDIAPYTESKGLIPAANLSSTVLDLARFAIFSSDRTNTDFNSILKASTRAEMQRASWLKSDWKSARGLGFSLYKTEDGLHAGHGGWVAGYRSQLLFDPDKKTAVIVMMNAEDFSPFKLAQTVLDLWSKWKLKTPAGYSLPQDWAKLTDQYFDTSYWQTDVIELDKKLYFYDYSYPPSADPTKALRILVHESGFIFRLAGPNGNGEPVIFQTDQEDQVDRIKVGANYIYPHSKAEHESSE